MPSIALLLFEYTDQQDVVVDESVGRCIFCAILYKYGASDMLSTLASLLIAQSTCLNYWVHPQTGEVQCFQFQQGQTQIQPERQEAPAGYELLAATEVGDGYASQRQRIFIKARTPKKSAGAWRSNANVRTYAKGKLKDWTYYNINCDRRHLFISFSSTNPTILNNPFPIVVGQPGTIGYLIWEKACSRD